MSATYTCPRCGREVRPPGIWSDTWTCPVHAAVAPLRAAVVASEDAVRQTALRSAVPVWLPWPPPRGWLLTGLRVAGDDHTGPVAVVVALSGPNPLTVEPDDVRVADLLLVAEQPGVGLGAGLAGLEGLDPGGAVGTGEPHLKLVAAGHDTPMWAVETDGAAAYVGEAAGVWLWAVAWPSTAAAVLLEQFELRDARDGDLPAVAFGALSPRLH